MNIWRRCGTLLNAAAIAAIYTLGSFASAQASVPDISYTLTAPVDPVLPGQTAEFDVTVTNNSSSNQTVTLYYTVPTYTYNAGNVFNVSFGTVAAGTSQSAIVTLSLNSGANAAPTGSPITLTLVDEDRGNATTSRTIIVSDAPVLDLNLSSSPAVVAPGGQFVYALTYSSVAAVSNAILRVPVPTNATFVSADNGGVLGSDGVVQWSLGSLPSGGSGQVHLVLSASTTASAASKILVEASLSDGSGDLAHSSASTQINSNPAISYTLTAPVDPVLPGQTAAFDVTVTNNSNSNQTVTLYYTVPSYTYNAGNVFNVSFGTVAPGASQSAIVTLSLNSGANAAPTGSPVTLTLVDDARGASVSRTIIASDAPVLDLNLSSSPAVVAPGGQFVYALTYSSVAAVSNAILRVPAPANATFVSADNGGVLGSDGAVQWSLGALPSGGSGQVHLVLSASSTASAASKILVEASLSDGSGDLAHSSASTQINSNPAISYTLTAPVDPVLPGQTAAFDVTVTNNSNSNQTVTLYYTVPSYTYNAGNVFNVSFGTVAPGTSQSAIVTLSLNSGANSAPTGSPITLTLVDDARGASVSRTIIASDAPVLDLNLSSSPAVVAPGGQFVYALTYSSVAAVSNAILRVPAPANATFVSADNGGVLGSDGAVQWSLGALPSGGSGQVHLVLSASSTASAASKILVEASLSDGSGDLAHSSASTQINSNPAISYTLTAPVDPVLPGQTAAFDVTVTNNSNSNQTVTLYYTVPSYTYNAGNVFNVSFGTVAPGTSQSAIVTLSLNSGANAAPTGSPITLTLVDDARGASVSRTIIASDAPDLDLNLSSSPAVVAPGGQFVYALTYSSVAAVSNAILRVPVPTNATFVSADNGGVLGSDGAVQWSLGALPSGGSGQVHLVLSASSTASAASKILVEASLSDGSGDLAHSSASTQINSNPAISYTLTAPVDPVLPGQTAAFDVTVTNNSNSNQTVTLYYTVPSYTYNAGNVFNVSFGTVAPGTSQSAIVTLSLNSGANSAPTGSPITLTLVDDDRGASVSQTITVQSPPGIESANAASGVTGQPFTYQITANNAPSSYGASGLPAGLNVNTSTGVISGTPSVTGTFTVTITATNLAGAGTETLTLTITAASPSITSAGTASGTQGQPFSYQISATNSPAGYGAVGLPAGLQVDPNTGIISGTPGVAGTFTITISATNTGGTGTAPLTLTLAPASVPALPTITLSAAVAEVTAGTGEVGEFLLTRTGDDLSTPLTVNYLIKGSAVGGVDYVALKGFKKMKAGKATVRISVTPIGDGAGPGVKRVVTLVLAPGQGYTVGTTAKVKVKIYGQ